MCGSTSLQPKKIGVPSKRPDSHSHLVPGGPIAPPLNATKPPKRDTLRIANSVVRHAPCEKPSMHDAIARDAGRFDVRRPATPAPIAPTTGYGSFLAISAMKLYGYQVLFAAAGAR